MAPSINYSASYCNCNHTGFSGFVCEQSKIRVEEREQYEKDLKEFTLAAMQGALSSRASGVFQDCGMVAELSLNMAIVQMNAIKQHLTEKYKQYEL